MKRLPAIFFASLMLLTQAFAANPPTNPQAAIRQVLEKQVQAWNRQDLSAFMQGYWHSPKLTFFSGATEHQGWEAAMERYRKAYQSEGRQMGKLAFSDLQIETLGPAAALVRGSFQLTMPDGKQPHGIFTLVFRKFPEGWRIIHDHTCAAE
ncbi:MAG TPA: nuclear transport factor 2 family protein [Terriglobales bacterium]|nr:nuclear transport factor 2 family protein [Terriglobales bacterium]